MSGCCFCTLFVHQQEVGNQTIIEMTCTFLHRVIIGIISIEMSINVPIMIANNIAQRVPCVVMLGYR